MLKSYFCNVKSILQACVITDLLEQVTKMSCNSESYLSATSQEAENDVLFPEECLGIQVAIRLGTVLDNAPIKNRSRA